MPAGRRSRTLRAVLTVAVSLCLAAGCTDDPPRPSSEPTLPQASVAPTIRQLSALFAPRPPAPRGLRRGGSAVVAVPAEATVLDPFAAAGESAATHQLAPLWLPGLWRVGTHGARTQWLATGPPKVSADGLRVQVDLRADARWSDGTRITSADVAGTWRYAVGRPGPWRAAYAVLTGVETPSPTRAVLVLARRSVAWTRLFVAPTGVLPVRHLPPAGAGGYDARVGGGPFVLAARTAGLGSTWRRTTAPWPGSDPHLDRVDVRVVPDFLTARDLLHRGDIHVVAPYDAVRPAERLSGPGVTAAATRSAAGAAVLVLRTDRGPLADVRVRQALALAIDRPAFAAAIVRGDGALADDLVAPGLPGHRAAFRRWRRDVPAARRLLDAAGWRVTDSEHPRRRRGVELNLTLAAAAPADLGDVVIRGLQLQARELGFQLELAAADADVAEGLARSGGADLHYTRWDSDVVSDLPRRLGRGTGAPAGANTSRWTDTQGAHLLDALASAPDLPELDRAVAAAAMRIAAELPVLPLYTLHPVTTARGVTVVAPAGGYGGAFGDIDRWART